LNIYWTEKNTAHNNVNCTLKKKKMNRLIWSLLFIIILGCQSTKEKKLLFIGNSLTYYNDMPKMLTEMFAESKVNIQIMTSTYPGYSLGSHLNTIIMKGDSEMIYTRLKKEGENTATEEILLKNDFDIVILQEQSGLMLIPEIVNKEVSKNVLGLKDIIGSESEILLYQNYPLNFRHPNVICREVNSTEYCTDSLFSVDQEMKLITSGFEQLDDGKNLVRIGEIFKYIMLNENKINLFSDEGHPSLEGSFLIALKFYKDITGKNCSNLKYKNKLDIKTSNKLKEIVDKV
tara:strand:- start:689 stop:1555 length:867 start_codon:yes stop_codon:yes gene_type:complete